MKRKHKRLLLLLLAALLLGSATALVLGALQKNLLYFYYPSQLTPDVYAAARPIRLGGLVQEDSIAPAGDLTVRFAVRDNDRSVDVIYTGVLPDLFREGQGVIVEGRFDDRRDFVASRVLAKHDENYQPPQGTLPHTNQQ